MHIIDPHSFDELNEIERLIDKLAPWARAQVLATVKTKSRSFPIHAITLGPDDPKAPIFFVTGGVHGLEKVGTHLAINFMNTLARMLSWDKLIHNYLETSRIAIIPLINPGGMYLRRRANPNGVDLMRNAPVEAVGPTTYRLVGGHRISPRLPWYRGEAGAPLETESQALCDFTERTCFPAKVCISIDLHSGFGLRDRLWFPYAKSRDPFPSLAEVWSLRYLFKKSNPNHVYRIEPQSTAYTTHGDLWDYLYDRFTAQARPEQLFLPLSLELGSWLWVKKNPRQLFSSVGPFNPIKPHRFQRTMRRHNALLDFLMRAVHAHDKWAFPNEKDKTAYRKEAIKKWYLQSEETGKNMDSSKREGASRNDVPRTSASDPEPNNQPQQSH